MSVKKRKNLSPVVPFLYEMAISFLVAAREAIDPVLQSLGGFAQLETDERGIPLPPDQFAQNFGNLSRDEQIQYVGICLRSTTNLGLSYAHVLRLLVLLESKVDAFSHTEDDLPNIDLIQLYDSLPKSVQRELNEIYDSVNSQDFEIEISLNQSWSENHRECKLDLRQQLGNWQRVHQLNDSHYLFTLAQSQAVAILVPLRAIFILDQIISKALSTRLGIQYEEMDIKMSNQKGLPSIHWDGRTISVELPDKLGRTLNAKWNLTQTSVVRIREVGSDKWSLGFETPFTTCNFVDCDPSVEYEIQLTHRNEEGESSPIIRKLASA